MEEYIDDLLRRMADEETEIWHRAYDEAKALNDLLTFPYLQQKVIKAKKVSMKKDIYYLMTKLAINTKEIYIADYLIDRLECEQSPTLLSELLSNIYTLPEISSTNKIIPYIYHKNDSVRYWAVASLKLYKSLEAESALLKLLDTEENKDEITHICYTLFEIGTKQSILPLTKLLYSNSAYVRSTVIEVLAKIGGSDLQIVYIEALHDRNVMVKYEAVRAIYTYGDEMAMRAICERVNKIVARRRKNEVEPTDEAEIIIALRFLHKLANHEEVLKIFDKVYKKRGNLFMSEREWLRDNIAYFQEKERM
ncbi:MULTISPECIES: HEAT repeat domain-containing protein [Bacillus]|uniref:HEAT repeat domain-containing protein n=1 Tax=Bacillus cereus TaxID=1396 RepID=A0AAW7NCE3_BACCE|nr:MULTISPECIES: HEAT repeat domain-containing protein [Bacillus]MBY0130863.1 HEAT repeat domain-containing protein [Bacillus cereus]MCJ0847561.1 HEAT repeat domain-containing protein [Bacillus cereus]MCU5742983.1 HEAT repeat domain-containing protein [Bacillus cereus]MCU9576209.1 HEAT repeat domain-containing protein [Bacillus cereus]MDA2048207.1 HEAT repeat domain-containing protein [Bacillus cereus]